jgi:hypothetical protein
MQNNFRVVILHNCIQVPEDVAVFGYHLPRTRAAKRADQEQHSIHFFIHQLNQPAKRVFLSIYN